MLNASSCSLCVSGSDIWEHWFLSAIKRWLGLFQRNISSKKGTSESQFISTNDNNYPADCQCLCKRNNNLSPLACNQNRREKSMQQNEVWAAKEHGTWWVTSSEEMTCKGLGRWLVTGTYPLGLGNRNVTEDFFLSTPDCTARACRKDRNAMTFQKSFAQIKWYREEAISFHLKSRRAIY